MPTCAPIGHDVFGIGRGGLVPAGDDAAAVPDRIA